MEPIIKVKDLSFFYTHPTVTKALEKINFEVGKGEFLAILGENGAGKTTLCLCLAGIIPHIIQGELGGTITLAGLEPYKHPLYEITQKVGIVLQDPETQIFCSDVKSEVAFGPENLGLPRDEILERIQWALKVARLGGLEDRLPHTLSGGQKQRLAVASILAMKPEILILDEPTSQLDPIGTTEVFSVIKDLKEKYGVTIVMTEHKTEEVAEFADKVIALCDGQIVLQGKPDEVLNEVGTLSKINIKIPQVTELASKVNEKIPIGEIPITLDDASLILSKLFKAQKLSFNPNKIALFKGEEKEKREKRVVLEAKDLWFTYPGGVTALKNINVKIHEGEFVAITGQNGSGKTTLVKNFIGLLKPTKGSVYVEGEDVGSFTTGELAKRIGLILQNPDYQLFELNVEKEVAFGPRNIGLPEDEVKRRVDETLKELDIEKYRKIYPFNLSFGIRRKVTVASVLVMRPKILIFDEPTTAQDHPGRYRITDLAKSLHENGHTIIMITHDMDLVAKYAQRIIVMGMGEIILDGSTREVFAHSEILKQTYLKPPQITQLAQALEGYNLPPPLTVEEMYEVLSVGGR